LLRSQSAVRREIIDERRGFAAPAAV